VSVWAIVVAAGGGSRFGAPKQFARLAGATVLDRALATACRCCDGAIVVLNPSATWAPPDGVTTTAGGTTRSESVRAGLALVPTDADIVVVHDAARPLASPQLWLAVVAAVRAGADCAVPAIPVVDTLKRVDGVAVVETVDRTNLVAVQTPQAFRATALRAAHARDTAGDTDDATSVERTGGRVVTVTGETRNFKITIAADLELAAAILETA
jgi:2-C-methyl-D-erythritol 4-phosphate cytidylyltransferase